KIAHIEVLDSRNLVFHLREPHAPFLYDLELPILRWENRGRRISWNHPVGAGPYVLMRSARGRFELHANPYWHRGKAAFRSADLIVVRDDNTRALRLLGGAGDLALNAVPPLLVPLFLHDRRFQVKSGPGIATLYLGFNLEAPPVNQIEVRRAIASALDRE